MVTESPLRSASPADSWENSAEFMKEKMCVTTGAMTLIPDSPRIYLVKRAFL